MKLNIAATLLALIFNLINFFFWLHLSSMPNATSMIYLFIYPCFWIITLIIVLIIAVKNTATWFSKTYKISTIIALLFCTPIPILVVGALTSPSTYGVSTGFSTVDGYTLKEETWDYLTGELYVIKHWKANQPDCSNCDTSYFMRDSVWVYLDRKKDTIKIEKYKNGKLINEIKK